MSKLVKGIIGVVLTVVGAVIPGARFLVGIGLSLVGSALRPTPKGGPRDASAAQLQLGEYPRTAIIGRSSTAGSLVDAFNYGGTYGTDWELLVIALADHRCDALEGFYVNDTWVPFAGDGDVAGYNGQLKVYFRSGTESQALPSIVMTSNPAAGWTANDNGAGVCYVVVAYKADAADSKTPVWTAGRPRFLWVVRGLRCYDPRKDSTVPGGAGAHRWNNPATWEWSENPIVCRYNWARGIYACDRVDQPDQLLIGRGLSAIEAPPENVAWRANLCDELVGGVARYRVGGVLSAAEQFLNVEEAFAAACAGTIIQPEGAVEIDPGEARAPVAHFTDADLVVGTKVRWQDFLGAADADWINTVVPSYVEPAQKWGQHAAPVRRDTADLIADGGPRELPLSLAMVTNAPQAGRIGEIHRRLGRLPGRGQVTLPPRFAAIEEGDWVTWQSDRYFNGATRTLRVDAWASDQGWRHQLVLRQISATAYSDLAPLTDGSIVSNQAPPPAIAAPGAGSWSLAAGHLAGSGIRVPALIVTGASDNATARFVRVEYVQQTGAPGPATIWTDNGVTGPDVVRREIPAAPGGTYYVGVSYVVDGVQGPRLVLGPVVAGQATYLDGTPIDTLRPGDPGATLGDNLVFNSGMSLTTTNTWWGTAARVAGAAGEPAFFARSTSLGAGGSFNNGALIPVVPNEIIYVSGQLRDATPSTINFWRFNPLFYNSQGVFLQEQFIDLQANSATFATRRARIVVPAGAAYMVLNLLGYLQIGASVDLAYPRFARTELQADVTANAQVSIALTTDQVIPATYNGTVTTVDLANIVWAPVVTRGGSSIKTANGTTYSLANASGGTFAVDNTNGSGSKGNVTISAMSSNIAQVELTITVDNVVQPKLLLKVTKNLGAPPPPSGGSTPKTVTWGAGDFLTLNTTSYSAVVVGAKTVALASGESLYGTAPLTYNVAGTNTPPINRTMTFKWQYSVAGANSWNDFASPITGTVASTADYTNEIDPVPGSVAVTQTKRGLGAGNYDVRLVAICSATGRNMSTSGTATVEAKV